MKQLSLLLVLALSATVGCMAKPKKAAQPQNIIDDPREMAIAFAEDEMARFPELWQYDYGRRPFFGYTQGVGGTSFLYLYRETGDRRYFDYAEHWCDTLINDDGTIKLRAMESYNLDLIRGGWVVSEVYRELYEHPELVPEIGRASCRERV